MKNNGYKYEVAFSFLKEDEAIAIKINDLIQDRFKTFLYSKNQEEVAGTDGEITFNKVFGSDSRIVIVLYRENWGKTSWTRIEETAIRTRAYDEGFEFTIFIPLEKGLNLPKWLPITQIYVGYERWGLDGIASVIEARVQQAGGESRVETVHDKAQRKKRELEFKENRKKYLESNNAVSDANTEVIQLFKQLESLVIEVNEKNDLGIISERASDNELYVFSKNYCIYLYWHQPYSNVIEESKLIIKFQSGPSAKYSRVPIVQPQVFSKKTCFFDVDPKMKPIWIVGKKDNQLYTTKLSEYCLTQILDRITN